MAFLQSDWAKGILTPPQPWTKGAVMTARFSYTFAATFAFTGPDKLELGILPPRCRIIDAKMISVTATNVVDIGIMSGEVGVIDAARTIGDELFDGVAMNVAGVRTINFVDIETIVPTEAARSIGLFATAVDIAAAGKITLELLYTSGL